MTPEEILEAFVAGELSKADALTKLRPGPIEDLGFARLDHDRVARRGFPEVIYGAGKTPEHIHEIFSRLAEKGPNVLSTRTSPEAAERVLEDFPEARYDPLAKALWLQRDETIKGKGPVLVKS